MKKLILIGLIGCLTVILSGCSYLVDFVIVNNSDDFIEIVCDGYVEFPLKIVTAEEFDKNNIKEWREIPPDRYKISDETKSTKIRVAANEALRITRMSNDKEENLRKRFDVRRLKISGKNGLIELEGGQVFEGFEPKKQRWVIFGPDATAYTIHYK